MSEPVARISRIDIILWTLVAEFIVTNVVLPPLGVSTLALSVIFVFVSAAFLVLHGTLSYGWRAVLIFSALALVISNAMENLSIVTGFPFGHYHYSSTLGPKLFLVPILIGPAYVTVGYLAWTIAGILLNMRKPGDRAFRIVALPVVASFVMETPAIIGLFVIGFVAIVAILKVLTEGDAPIDRDVVETGHVMSSASSPDSSRQLRTLKEALRTRLAPDEWSAIFEREPETRPRNRGANERLDGPPRV